MSGNIFNIKSIEQLQQNPYNNNLIEEPKEFNQRLNGYDSSLLNQKNTKIEESINLEYKIGEKQNELTDIIGKIKIAENYGSPNEVMVLRARKHRIEKELFELNQENAIKKSNIKTLSDEIEQLGTLRRVQTFLSKNILSKVSKRFDKIAFLGESLKNLNSINRNVDALLEMDIPYGERSENYQKLTQYLTKANQIHSQISKTMKNI